VAPVAGDGALATHLLVGANFVGGEGDTAKLEPALGGAEVTPFLMLLMHLSSRQCRAASVRTGNSDEGAHLEVSLKICERPTPQAQRLGATAFHLACSQ